MPEDFDACVRRLYEEPPDRFVATRAAAVAAARAAGDRDTARRFAALRKPTVAAWLVNLLALRRPDLIDELVDLAAALRAAQRDLHGDQLRELSVQRRRAVSALVAEAQRLAVDTDAGLAAKLPLADVETTLTAALADTEVAEQVRTGRLIRTATYAGFGEVPRPRLRLVTDADPPPQPAHDDAHADADGDDGDGDDADGDDGDGDGHIRGGDVVVLPGRRRRDTAADARPRDSGHSGQIGRAAKAAEAAEAAKAARAAEAAKAAETARAAAAKREAERRRELRQQLGAARAAETRSRKNLERAEAAERDAGHAVAEIEAALAELERRRVEAHHHVADRKLARRAAQRDAATARRLVGDLQAALEDLDEHPGS